MPDDQSKTGAADRSKVAAGERYEVEYFARKHGLTMEEARGLIKKIGNDRAKLDAAAKVLKGRH